MSVKVFQKPEDLVPRHDFGIVQLPDDIEPQEMCGKKVPVIALDTSDVNNIVVHVLNENNLTYEPNNELQLIDGNKIVDQSNKTVYEQKIQEVEQALTVEHNDEESTDDGNGAGQKPGRVTRVDLDQDSNW